MKFLLGLPAMLASGSRSLHITLLLASLGSARSKFILPRNVTRISDVMLEGEQITDYHESSIISSISMCGITPSSQMIERFPSEKVESLSITSPITSTTSFHPTFNSSYLRRKIIRSIMSFSPCMQVAAHDHELLL